MNRPTLYLQRCSEHRTGIHHYNLYLGGPSFRHAGTVLVASDTRELLEGVKARYEEGGRLMVALCLARVQPILQPRGLDFTAQSRAAAIARGTL